MSEVLQQETLAAILRARAAITPRRAAFTFLGDGEHDSVTWDYATLDARARAAAAALQTRTAPGDRAILLYPAGLDFIAAFFGCLYTGVIAVPASALWGLRGRARLAGMIADAQPSALLTDTRNLDPLRAALADIPDASERLIATDALPDAAALAPPGVGLDTIAFLQYTSGSTSEPRGVMVSHGNVVHNCRFMQERLGHTPDSVIVSWLPHFHDMGLVAGILKPVFVGCSAVLLSPEHFVQRPVRWLRAITRHGGTFSVAPNFAYDLCIDRVSEAERAGLDLSSWRSACNGAEPVRAPTLRRFTEAFAACGFRPEALSPCYGLAEATLAVTLTPPDRPPGVYESDAAETTRERVGCGAPSPDGDLLIVNPETLQPAAPGSVGEIWVSSPSVARGYWARPQESAETFEARLADGRGPYLRTGDLGAFMADELVILGRLKDVVIIHGYNHYPQDIEATVEVAHAALRRGGCVAIGIDSKDEERLALVCEVERGHEADLDAETLSACIRRAVAAEHELDVHAIAFVRAGAVPKTTSGKVRRHACRAAFLDGSLDCLARWARPDPAAPAQTEAASTAPDFDALRAFLLRLVADRTGISESEMTGEEPFSSLGLSSIATVQLAGELERFLGRPLSPTIAYAYPSISALARALSGRAIESGYGCGSRPHFEPLAIVGMACRFPGADSLDAFWEVLHNGVDAISETPRDRWDIDRLYDPTPGTVDKTNTRWGGFLKDVDRFDARFFDISPREAGRMDPQQRILLEVSWHALEHAGIPPAALAGTRTGVFIGIGNIDYIQVQLTAGCPNDAYVASGNATSIAANRLSYFYDFRGPSVAVDTACSASLTSVHYACTSLRTRECDVALAGGVNLLLSPVGTVSLSQARMMSSDGRCKVFDAAADGYVRGEGCGIVVLKRLSDALAGGDRIFAVIRGTAVNHDGRTNGLTAPNGLAQEAVIRAALEDAQVAPAAVQYLEAHGTGTPVGDPIEFESIRNTLLAGRADGAPLRIGSVKTNIGHLEIAAGVAGLIKTVLALLHEEIPPHLHLRQLNPLIRADGLPVQFPTTPIPWPRDGGARLPEHGEDAVSTCPAVDGGARGGKPRIAGVSAFGFGGANAHVVLEEPPAPTPLAACSDRQATTRPRHVLTLSAHSDTALRALAGAYAAQVRRAAPPVCDLCFSANTARAGLPQRLAIVTEGDADVARAKLLHALDAAAEGVSTPETISGEARPGASPRIVYLFTGQGAQFPGMAHELYETDPEFREVLDRCSAMLKDTLSVSLIDAVYPPDGMESPIHQTAWTQPALFALEVALAQRWMHWGLVPDVVIGHSIGELAAACVAGAFSLETGLELAALRGRLMQSLPDSGAMTAIFADRETVAQTLRGHEAHVVIATYNGPNLQVISGEREAVAAATAKFAQRGIRTEPLTVSHAFHSPLMDPILDAFEQGARQFAFAPLRVPLVSNRGGALLPAGTVLDARYWREQVRNPVDFDAGMRALDNDTPALFIEMGPASTLIGMGRRCIAAPKAVWLPSLSREPDNWRALLSSLANAWVCGAPVDWKAFHAHHAGERVDLPLYPFQRMSYWCVKEGPTRTAQSADSRGNTTHRDALDEDMVSRVRPLLYNIAWEQTSVDVRASRTAGDWLILCDEQGFGEALAHTLAQSGQKAFRVRRGGTYRKLADACTASLNFEDLHCLVRDFLAQAAAPRGIVICWDLDYPASTARLGKTPAGNGRNAAFVCSGSHESGDQGAPTCVPSHGQAARSAERGGDAASTYPLVDVEARGGCNFSPGTLALLYSAQALARHADSREAPRIHHVTRNAMWVCEDDPAPTPEQAPAWGLFRTVAVEYPDFAGKLLDVAPDIGPDASERVAAELLSEDGESIVAWRRNTRRCARLRRLNLADAQPFRFRADGAYLITGGFGGLGCAIARWAVRRGARRLILLARHPLPPRTEWASVPADSETGRRIAAVREIEGQGASVHTAAVDVGDASALEAVLACYAREQWPPIRGVFHLAGVLQDRLLPQLDPASFDVVFRAKAQGAWNLHHALQDAPLDCFVLFSSVASLLGAAGQGNYAAANAFLDAFAAWRRAQGFPALSINWGPWAEAGMAASELRGGRMARQGMRSLAPEEGLAALDMLLASGVLQAGVFHADWQQLRESYWNFADAPFLSALMAGATEMRREADVVRILSAAGTARAALLLELVRARVAAVLGLSAAEIATDRSVVELGMDSIMVTDLLSGLSRDLKFRIHPREVFDRPSLAAFADHLTRELDIHQQKESGETPPEGGYLKAKFDEMARKVKRPRKATHKNPPCVFIFAAPRSGSTLLRVILSANKALFSPPELHILPFEDLRDRGIALGDGKYLGDGLQRAFMEVRGCGEEESRALIDRMTADLTPVQDVYRMLQDGVAPRLLVDKSPSYSGSLDALRRAEDLFENPRYVYLHRHPYAGIASYVKNRTGRMFDFGHADPYLLAEEVWTVHNENILTFMEEAPEGRKIRLCYEELVRDPEPQLRAVCAVIGEPFDPDMLFPYEKGSMLDGVRPGKRATGDPNFLTHTSIDPSLADAWRNVELPRPLGEHARRIAERLQYDLPRDAPRTTRESLEFEEERL